MFILACRSRHRQKIIACPCKELAKVASPLSSRRHHYAPTRKRPRTINLSPILKWKYISLFNSPLSSSVLAPKADDWPTWSVIATGFNIKSVRNVGSNL